MVGKTILILVSIVGGLLLGVLSNWLFEFLKNLGLFPQKPSIKHILVIFLLFAPVLCVVTISNFFITSNDPIPSFTVITSTDVPTTSVAASPMSAITPQWTPTQTTSEVGIPTATPSMPIVTVSANTNCRAGPFGVDKDYEILGALLIGQTAIVVGRDATGEHWIIENPNKPEEECWILGQYATVSGNTSNLPIFAPP